jgi:phosphatidylinositol-3-phosphatase
MSSPDLHAAQLGTPGEPCAECGAPLAGDQRYCLNCGARRGARRLDPIAVARGQGATAAPPRQPPRRPRIAAAPLEMPGPRAVGAAALAVLGFGIAAGALAGPRAGTASAGRRPIAIVVSPPAAAPAPAPAATTPHPHAAPAPTPAPNEVAAAPPSSPAPAAATPAPSAPAHKAPAHHHNKTPAKPTPPAPVKHVWLVALANQGADALFGPQSTAPYLSKQLVPKGLFLPNWFAISHGEAPNLIAAVSGQAPNPATQADCQQYVDFQNGSGCVYPAKTATLADQLTGAGLTWRAYLEDEGNVPAGLPASCRHPDLGQPDPWTAPRPGDASLTRRDPFVYFHSIIDSADCGTQVVGLDRLADDLKDPQQTPAFSYLAPNACHDGRDEPCADGAPAGPPAADAWLQTVVPQILASKAYADGGLIVITSDQGAAADATGCCGIADGQGGGRVGALLLSPFVEPGASFKDAFDHLFGLDPLGHAGDADLPKLGGAAFPRSQELHKRATSS